MITQPVAVKWLLFLVKLAGRSGSTPRVRLWRAMKEYGAATLRDGVALLPASDDHREKLHAVHAQIEKDGGSAWILELHEQSTDVEEALRGLFDRGSAFREISVEAAALRSKLPGRDEAASRRRLRQLERDFEMIRGIDFFPGPASEELRQFLGELALVINRQFSPQEPVDSQGEVAALDPAHYQGRVWATRRRMWVDRVASAWLIRRFIDEHARFLWLENSGDCPADALGFDFDGATFTHVGTRVTFEVLLASFGLEAEPGLAGIGRLVHYLDVGGRPVAEAAGFEAVLAGMREEWPDDDALLFAVTPILDALHRRYSVTEA